tara:strand:- start:1255 stop:1512 length:258 start_codon:yes stop_codon:yes gene_type:complete
MTKIKSARTVIDKSLIGDLEASVKTWTDGTVWVNVSLHVDELQKAIEQRTLTLSGGTKVKTFTFRDKEGNKAEIDLWYDPEKEDS